MGWREAFRLSRPAFTEVAFQAIYAFRQGNVLPAGAPADLVARSRRRVLQSKAIIAFLIGFLTAGAALLLHFSARVSAAAFPYTVTPSLFDFGVLSALLGLDVALLWWTGLQVLPTLLSSAALPVLETLPVDARTLRRTSAIVYFRLFDVPALTVLGLTPLLVGLARGPLAGLAILPGALVSVVFALGLSLATARFFVRRVQGARSGGGSTLVRWAYLVLWAVPVFALFASVTLAPAFFAGLAYLARPGSGGALAPLTLVFPFGFAALSVGAHGGAGALPLGAAGWGVVAAAIAGYAALAAFVTRWLGRAVREVGAPAWGIAAPVASAPLTLHPTGRIRSVLVKDLRVASRTPGYAFLILLPILDSVALGLLTYLPFSSSATAAGLAEGAVASAALLATFFGPAFFAIEVIAYSYGRTLPLSDRSLALGKVALVVVIYLVAAGVVLGLAEIRSYSPFVFGAFVAAELPAVVAASLVELGLLLRRARRRGLAVVNLYASSWAAVVIAIPGLVLAALPLVALSLAGGTSSASALGIMGLVATAELLASLPLLGGRGTP